MYDNIDHISFQKKQKLTKATKNSRAKGGLKKMPATKKDSTSSSQEQSTGKASDTQSWPHLKYDFVQPDKIRDVKKRAASHPDYDPRTIYVPTEFLDKQTPVRSILLLILP